MRGTFTVRGMKLRNGSNRRYLVVAVRPSTIRLPGGDLVTFVETRKRSDSSATARKEADKTYRAEGVAIVVLDTVTGEELYARNPRAEEES